MNTTKAFDDARPLLMQVKALITRGRAALDKAAPKLAGQILAALDAGEARKVRQYMTLLAENYPALDSSLRNAAREWGEKYDAAFDKVDRPRFRKADVAIPELSDGDKKTIRLNYEEHGTIDTPASLQKWYDTKLKVWRGWQGKLEELQKRLADEKEPRQQKDLKRAITSLTKDIESMKQFLARLAYKQEVVEQYMDKIQKRAFDTQIMLGNTKSQASSTLRKLTYAVTDPIQGQRPGQERVIKEFENFTAAQRFLQSQGRGKSLVALNGGLRHLVDAYGEPLDSVREGHTLAMREIAEEREAPAIARENKRYQREREDQAVDAARYTATSRPSLRKVGAGLEPIASDLKELEAARRNPKQRGKVVDLLGKIEQWVDSNLIGREVYDGLVVGRAMRFVSQKGSPAVVVDVLKDGESTDQPSLIFIDQIKSISINSHKGQGATLKKSWRLVKQEDGKQMLALMIDDPTVIKALRAAVPEGVQPNDVPLHITLAMLPDDTADDKWGAVESALREIAGGLPRLSGTVSGLGVFNTDLEEGDCLYASFDSPDIAALRQALVTALNEAGVSVDMTHGFDPHITLGYIPQNAGMPDENIEPIPLTFECFTLRRGDKRTDFFFSETPGAASTKMDLVIHSLRKRGYGVMERLDGAMEITEPGGFKRVISRRDF